MSNNTNTPAVDQNQVGIGGYISLIFGLFLRTLRKQTVVGHL